MTYKESRDFVSSCQRFGIKPGLARVSKLLKSLSFSQKAKYIHIAGTSGKGSVAVMLSEILQSAGFKTGLYTSPYVLDFRERIQVNGEMIPKSAFAGLIARIAKKNIPELTEFETVTAAALTFFEESGCDWVVLETGLGGRLDATNVINRPEVTVIMPISLDHTDILGDTVAQIAAEKCGIIKSDGVTVSAAGQPDEALTVIKNTARARNNRLIIPDVTAVANRHLSISRTEFSYKNLAVSLPLCGEHQLFNALAACETAKTLSLSNEAMTAGLKKVRFPARVELLSETPPVILDGAHNPEKVAALIRAVSPFLERKAVFVFGTLADKDYMSELELIKPLCAQLIAVTPPGGRALPAAVLACRSREAGLGACRARSYKEALCLAREKSQDQNSPVIIFGSLYLAAALRKKAMQIFM
ncbi:MAG: bifunctional folylpolyglutamate synthase/dihydrofolate synthase [Oscillospiraceae bacterium]|jgi:dihydrofolate synthase/folylpolyglutamate synthase|nr:bifunctional folylpolyglutamate synthase/dihydrofolate synthase [Oscillospiraceae bacterium]